MAIDRALYYARRRIKAVNYLGGKCVRCGATERLEFDHIDPATVSFRVAGNVLLKWCHLVEELKKCQLLCNKCHWAKTRIDRKVGPRHGTRNNYVNYGCRCADCRKVNTTYFNALHKLQRKQRKLKLMNL